MWRLDGPYWDVVNTTFDVAEEEDRAPGLLVPHLTIDVALEHATPEAITLVEDAARRNGVRLTRLALPPRPRTENDPPETTGRPPEGR